MKFKTGLGQDSHAFENNRKTLLLAGVDCKHAQGLRANSDGDVVLHALTNAVSSITGVNILGEKADNLCQQGVTDSREYLKLALQDLNTWQVQHIAISIECLTPKISPFMADMKKNIAQLFNISTDDIGITATTGEGLSAFGKGEGIQVSCIISVIQT
ncbi:2-C-methyl-D-erythritol 2,4-cyclodiphosphate synthase [Candidatus Thioglobus autotrophicus]|uniref:2-C-methyl-D-erythritol 2,4-cyclodiphosphate synthase n=1 Tax=Candidatus Thioglobus autotrophicus TaxID=1705394 RepID=UPI00299DE3C0|nr:2-C-methyl-D-erythritol 2,4-cyclodiphosphate synthase [Candidatus Thioglobus autotrophicus]WPE16911.1 2-C-methyl-D-erythritol 2,4-cyclodiphosphate synthase [Candidatus Thioglobus autotrophicus]WPE18464.1 2-C-methyl-D-erythritol 2,4-cyclodiphosphate synthase [Candidatus Thioglobus autotrophicus]